MLGDVLEEEDAAVDAREVRRADEVRDQREVAAPQRPVAGDARGPFERALDLPRVVAEHAEAVVERERGRHGRAEIVRRHRAGERHHSCASERRELERREIGVPHPALARPRQRGEVDPVEEAREAIAAAQHQHDVGVGVRGDALDRGEALVVGRREALPAAARGRIAPHAVPEACKQRLRAVDGGRVGREPGGGDDREPQRRGVHAPFPRRAAKKPLSSAAHASAATPPSTLV